MEDDLSNQQKIKKELFKNQTEKKMSNFGKHKYNRGFQRSSDILNNLKNTSEFSKLKKNIEVHEVLSKCLPKGILKMVFFAYYKNQKLTIKVMHPVAQSEINHGKQNLISVFKKIPTYSDILDVAVFREDKLNKFSKDYNKDFYNIYNPVNKSKEEREYLMNKMHFFTERSVGIFENKAVDPKLKKSFDDIRKAIQHNRELDKERDSQDSNN